jgi:hypothetical protein
LSAIVKDAPLLAVSGRCVARSRPRSPLNAPGSGRRVAKRVGPAQPLEAREVPIGAAQREAVLDRQRGEVRVGYEIGLRGSPGRRGGASAPLEHPAGAVEEGRVGGQAHDELLVGEGFSERLLDVRRQLMQEQRYGGARAAAGPHVCQVTMAYCSCRRNVFPYQ